MPFIISQEQLCRGKIINIEKKFKVQKTLVCGMLWEIVTKKWIKKMKPKNVMKDLKMVEIRKVCY